MSAHGDEPAPLGESARAILSAARPHERLSAERKERLRGRVMSAVAAGAAVGLAAGTAKAAEVAASASGAGLGSAGLGAAKVAGLSLFAKIGLGVAVATVGVGGVLWTRAHDEASRPIPAVTATATIAASIAPSPSNEPAREDPATTAQAPAPDPTEKPAASAPKPASTEPRPSDPAATAEPVDSLQDEAKLLAAAHAELSRGNAGAALAILDQHAARYPRGTLAPERRATRAMALCKAGRTDEGRRELAVLYGADSKSPMAQKIDRACGKAQ